MQGGACAPPFEINDIHKPQYPSHEACAEVLNCSYNFHDIVVDLNLYLLSTAKREHMA